MTQLLIFVLGLIVNTVVLFAMIMGFLRASLSIAAHTRRRVVARVGIMALGICMVVGTIIVAIGGPILAASASGFPLTRSVLMTCIFISFFVTFGLVVYAAKTSEGRRYYALDVWGPGWR